MPINGKYGNSPTPPPTLNPQTITAEAFVDYMENIWDNPSKPTEQFWADYDKYSNARLTAKSLGAKRTGGGSTEGEHGYEYVMEFPSGARIRTNSAGCEISPLPTKRA